jgi:tetraacyldisaccharide 4'-kinase
MRSPDFWWKPAPTILADLLRPPSLVYGTVAGRRMARTGEGAAVPVICVGNLTVGGAGKTPTALMLAGLLRAAGMAPVFLSRGYGGRLSGPVRVEAEHGAQDVGDEPLLLARAAPTIVSRDRPAGARLAVEAGAGIIIMDDGLQNPSLRKDFALAVVDGTTGIGNGLVLPAGPLRAPLRWQWPAVDAVLVIGEGAAGERLAGHAAAAGKTVFHGTLVPDSGDAARLRGEAVLAFAGIGRPAKFRETLESACGAIVKDLRAFSDHHLFSHAELSALQREAKERGLRLVTTEKDVARIRTAPDLKEFTSALLPVAIHLQVAERAALKDLLLSRLGSP